MPQKSKPQSVWSKLWSAPKGPKKAHGATKKEPPSDNRPSLAEQINFGGRYPDKSKDPKSKKY